VDRLFHCRFGKLVLLNKNFANPFLAQRFLLGQGGSDGLRRNIPLLLQNLTESAGALTLAQGTVGKENCFEIAVGINRVGVEARGKVLIGVHAQTEAFSISGRNLLAGLIFDCGAGQSWLAGELDEGDIVEMADFRKAILVPVQLDMGTFGMNRPGQRAGFFHAVQKFDGDLGLHSSSSTDV
jgi:hypothetical protein